MPEAELKNGFMLTKVTVGHDPAITLAWLLSTMESGFGDRYEVVAKKKTVIVKESDWKGVVVQVKHRPSKQETVINVIREVPELKNRLLVLPLMLLAILPGIAALFLMKNRGKDIENEVAAYLVRAPQLGPGGTPEPTRA